MAKGFATRLAPVAHKVIHRNQMAFIWGTGILDGVVVVHEIRCSKEVFILKLDFEKAYDQVRWDFLKEKFLLRKGLIPCGPVG